MLQGPNGEEKGFRLLEDQEARVESGELEPSDVLTPFMHVSEDKGLHVGHIICRNQYYDLMKAFVQGYTDQWRIWMNTPSFIMKAPYRWCPAMSFFDSVIKGCDSYPEHVWGEYCTMAWWIMHHSSFDTLKTPGLRTGNFIHMSAAKSQADILEKAFITLHRMDRPVGDIINLPNGNGQSAYDVAWNHKPCRNMLKSWGGEALKPLNTLPRDGMGKGGKDIKGRGLGGRDGVTVDHRYNRAYR